jgi:hypothetical protein
VQLDSPAIAAMVASSNINASGPAVWLLLD